jgi:hypothetical protein
MHFLLFLVLVLQLTLKINAESVPNYEEYSVNGLDEYGAKGSLS